MLTSHATRRNFIVAILPRPYFGEGEPGPITPDFATPDEAPPTPPLAKTIEPPPLIIPKLREDIQAGYTFTADELARMNNELLQALNAADMLESQRKSANADFKLRIQNKENDSMILRNKLTAGEETRAMRVAVDFDTKRGVKLYLHPETGALVREETMQPADYQVQMDLERAETASEVSPEVSPDESSTGAPAADISAAKTLRKRVPKAPGTSPVGATSVGNVIDKAAAKTDAPLFLLDLTRTDWESGPLYTAFKKAAKAVGWTTIQISLLKDRLMENSTIEAMLDTLRPFTIGNTPIEEDIPEEEPTEEDIRGDDTPDASLSAGVDFPEEDPTAL